MTPPPTPRTAAGRALLARGFAGSSGGTLLLDAILAIEREATEIGVQNGLQWHADDDKAEAASPPLSVERLARAFHVADREVRCYFRDRPLEDCPVNRLHEKDAAAILAELEGEDA